MIADVLIIGSGPSGVHAAVPIVNSGYAVRMLDVGHEDQAYAGLIPDRSFEEIRRTDAQQFRYFLGDRFEGIALGPMGSGPQLTPPKQYVIRNTHTLTPITSNTFFPLESLALGGLAGAWGAGVFPFTEQDLSGFPISWKDLAPHYEVVAERIGVSGERDDLLPFYGECQSLLPALRNDINAQTILAQYGRRRAQCHAAGLYIGQPRLAALSQPYRGRGPDRYLDMSFWGDADRSIYRPKYTLAELQSFTNFSYHRPVLALSFHERSNGLVEVICENGQTGKTEKHIGKSLILAAGILGTTRIVLRSMNRYEVKVPLLANPYTYVPMLNMNMLGRVPTANKHSLAQLCVVHAPHKSRHAPIHAHVHSYRSLLSFKLARELPLPYREGIRLMKWLIPSLAILAIDHEDRPAPSKYCRLHRGTPGKPDELEIQYKLSDEEINRQRRQEHALLRQFLHLRCIPLVRVRAGCAASAHYGGTFPMTGMEKELTVDTSGHLRGTRSVYLADGSVFPYLPAKALTFTMMANANRIGTHLCEVLKEICHKK